MFCAIESSVIPFLSLMWILNSCNIIYFRHQSISLQFGFIWHNQSDLFFCFPLIRLPAVPVHTLNSICTHAVEIDKQKFTKYQSLCQDAHYAVYHAVYLGTLKRKYLCIEVFHTQEFSIEVKE